MGRQPKAGRNSSPPRRGGRPPALLAAPLGGTSLGRACAHNSCSNSSRAPTCPRQRRPAFAPESPLDRGRGWAAPSNARGFDRGVRQPEARLLSCTFIACANSSPDQTAPANWQVDGRERRRRRSSFGTSSPPTHPPRRPFTPTATRYGPLTTQMEHAVPGTGGGFAG